MQLIVHEHGVLEVRPLGREAPHREAEDDREPTELEKGLRRWRIEEASRRGVSNYEIITERTITDIVEPSEALLGLIASAAHRADEEE